MKKSSDEQVVKPKVVKAKATKKASGVDTKKQRPKKVVLNAKAESVAEKSKIGNRNAAVVKGKNSDDASFNGKLSQLASKAFGDAHARALKTRGYVLIARNGQLGEIRADGSFKVIREITAPTSVKLGAVRYRVKPRHD